ncbi:flagellar motor control protein ZomB [Corynebacterium liangguodongii]|uniref:Terminal beta-(1->2)-arabinofuranosyltransferase C-terminal domain-containing protein n=1 Tax=Corynebacterium liangguodongii TaxID=2079535 RepID=A0A2S0WGI8_9CORY|nr:flagellar motor control protein ZomB [Corynebacterium liangguodongii]AWB84846.1 hypothetical protein C3E79_10490 [Corynebacterium liangguodongii]PWB99203.1 hypothetical protein DF219_08105 [Corynebacterium liangguodongii]
MTHNARLSLRVSMLVAGVFALAGGWAQRWMSDDGLIVLRTVRNILAGHGPVFNAGERVEANTSTLWQYLIALVGWITGARLESVALWLSLLLTAAACVLATWAAGRYWGQTVLPFGVIIYLALPPARDFATSGLEWGLSLFWFGLWWALLVRWAQPPRTHAPAPVGYWLAVWSGLSWLVRPELALYGGVTGLLLLAATPRAWWKILLVALPIPAAYQVFRMGYYGLVTPHTAVAKSASDSAWGEGMAYLWDFAGTYALWLIAAAALAVGAIAARTRAARTGARAITAEAVLPRDEVSRGTAIVALALGCGFLHVLYVLRVGGDFMHGRMLLLPLFALLLPVMAVPLTKRITAVCLAVFVWATVVVARGHAFEPLPPDSKAQLGVVDERGFWVWATTGQLGSRGRAPLYAEDFLSWRLMSNYHEAIAQAQRSGAAQIHLVQVAADPAAPGAYEWLPRPRTPEASDLNVQPLTLYLVNLGMTSMNAGLDVRVLDTVGLATPLAARMPRLPDARIGHDKLLPPEWQIADTGVDVAALPEPADRIKIMQARAALRTPEIRELLATSREPLSWSRFISNIKFSLTAGRHLSLDDDPAAYLDESTLSRINAGEDVGLVGPRVAWPRDL